MMTTFAEIPQAATYAPDRETHVNDEHHESLRLWLRLLTCTLTIERNVRGALRERFAITLPRFDLMAQLDRHPKGLKMGELSRRLMVTGGNVTGLTEALVAEGMVERVPIVGDRRSHAVRLTDKGKAAFDTMAAEHERWIVGMLAGVPPSDRSKLYALLGALKAQLTALDPDASP